MGVDQPGLEPVLRQIERRPPVVAGRLHHHPADSELGQPVTQAEQRGGHRGDGADLLHPLCSRAGYPHATDHLGLADIQRRDPLDDLGLISLDPHPSRPLSSLRGDRPQELQGTANLILVLEAHATALSTAPSARLQNGLERPGDYDVNGRPRLIFSPERLSPAGDERDFRDTGIPPAAYGCRRPMIFLRFRPH
jgi:hypothetical protein